MDYGKEGLKQEFGSFTREQKYGKFFRMVKTEKERSVKCKEEIER